MKKIIYVTITSLLILTNLNTNAQSNDQLSNSKFIERGVLLIGATLEFMSFEKIDPFGGVIISDWFINTSTKDLRNKVIVSFSSSELKATSIKVSVVRERYEDGNWVSGGYSEGLARKIEDLILSRARELRQSNEN